MSQEISTEAAHEHHALVGSDATKETLEDYTLRFAPRHYRRWSPGVVAISALGGIAYLADFAIGANIGIAYGTTNAVWGIAVFAVVIFVTGFPVAYYAARYNIDLDLITRGSGFGYYGSVVTNVIFATFTFIFFALEGSIMAQGLLLGLGMPLWAGYAVSTMIIFPLVIYGMKVLSKLQLWTTPLWLLLMVIPFAYLLISHPESVETFFAYQGEDGNGQPSLGSVMLAAGVCLSLIAQIAEQIDYLRFMPPRTPENKRRWWTAMILAGPGWVIFGAVKQVIGLFLAVYIIADRRRRRRDREPTGLPVPRDLPRHDAGLVGGDAGGHPGGDQPDQDQRDQCVLGFAGLDELVHPGHQALPGTAGLRGGQPVGRAGVDGSEHVRLPQHDPRLLRQLRHGLGRHGRRRHHVQQVPAEDLADEAGVPPRACSTRSTRSASSRCWCRPGVDRGLLRALGPAIQPYSPLVAIVLALVLTPVIAVVTKGRFYLRRTDDGIDLPMFDDDGNPSDYVLTCHVCRQEYERPDMTACQTHDSVVCSLCLSTDKLKDHVLPAQTRTPEPAPVG